MNEEILSARKIYSSLNLSGLDFRGLAGKALTGSDLVSIYGSPEAFLQRYTEFQENYIKLLKNGKVDSSKVGRVNLDTLIAGRKNRPFYSR
jgi:hypothetical protein